MSRFSVVFFLSAIAFFSFSCKTTPPSPLEAEVVIETESEIEVEIEINGDVLVEKNHPNPLLFSPDMKEYRLYGDLASEIAQNSNFSIIFLRGVIGDSREADGRIPFEVRKILKGGRQ